MSTDGILEYQGTKRVLFRGDTSNIVFDTRTTSLGIGVTGSNDPSSNLYITGNAYVSSNLAIGGVMTMGVVNVAARHNLQAVTDMGNVTTHTVEFTNPTTSIVASGNVSVGKDLTVSENLTVSGDFYAPGSVVQIQTNVFTGTATTTNSSWKDINSSFGVTITPKFANSSFLIQAMIHQGGDQSTDARWTMYRIGRYVGGGLTEVGNGNTTNTGGNGTVCVAGHNWGGEGSSGSGYNEHQANINILYVDVPNTTSPITYRIRWNSNPGGSGSRKALINRAENHGDGFRANTISTLVVTEIAQ